jgi:hypothetical protein
MFHSREEKYVEVLGENQRKSPLGRPTRKWGIIILKYVLEKWNSRVLTGFTVLRIGKSVRLWRTQ